MEFEAAGIAMHGQAARQTRYRASIPDYQEKHNAYRKNRRAEHIPEFVGVDSEGITTKNGHIAILVGCGDKHLVARDKRHGLHWSEVFEFLYSEFEARPKGTVFVGFYLKYDFNEWLKSLPEKVARSLLTPAGKAARKVAHKAGAIYRRDYRSVHFGGWEIDIIGMKRLSIRPDVCECHKMQGIKCEHVHPPFLHVCDAGPFFQKSFMKVIEEWPDIRSREEYETIKQGKEELRMKATWRDLPKMKKYNALENEILGRAMRLLCEGLKEADISLPRDKWYGPGAVAQNWLRKNGILRNEEIEAFDFPGWKEFLDACRKSYIGGWFEIFSHGIIKGTSWNYDINSAYPYATTMLPHICNRCTVKRGTGKYTGDGRYVLLYCTVSAKGDRIGPVPHRNSAGSICRPHRSKGWHWKSELDAAYRAGLARQTWHHEWVEFIPCDDSKPLAAVADLYNQRMDVAKNSPLGKNSPLAIAIKLLINSIYGKFAQSIGGKPYNNWFYASRITSSCRTQILDAIATHPGKQESVLMVATDGICFDSRHPSLPVNKELGAWDESSYEDLCLFKPGVYWHKEGKEALLKLKSRGVPAISFQQGIEKMEFLFNFSLECGIAPGSRVWYGYVLAEVDAGHIEKLYLSPSGWPRYPAALPFRMTSVAEALNRNDWSLAGHMEDDPISMQDSNPVNKRREPTYNRKKKRIDSYLPYNYLAVNLETIYYKDIEMPPHKDHGVGLDRDPHADRIDLVTIARDKPSHYDIELDEGE